ncbi:MAG TPA: tail fiber domain-containing protein [Flavobacteriales bacterium]|nr:tail fiber domain-containing protein [Flavobacteriales bacterium]
MKKKIKMLALFYFLGSVQAMAQPIGTAAASTEWHRGGNNGTGGGALNTNNILGFDGTLGSSNLDIWFETNGIYRMAMLKGGTGIGGGRLAFGNNLAPGFIPADRFHSHTTVAGANMFRFTNPTTNSTNTDGVRYGLVNVAGLGYGTGDVALFDQNEQSIFRFDITNNGSPAAQQTKFTIGNINQVNTTTTFQPTYTDVPRLGIWNGSSYAAGIDPLAAVHIGEPAPLNVFAHRDWMNLGTYYNTASDGMYVGIKENAGNGMDAVVAWGDDGGAAPANQGDRLKFIFNTSFSPGGGLLSGAADGLEVARFNTVLGNDGSVIFNGGSIGGTIDPGNTVHIVGQSTNGNAATPGGNAGLRFHFLNAATPVVANPGPGVLSVDANGDVIYVIDTTGTGCCDTAQNGLNIGIAGPNIIELGGPLLHHTNVTSFVGRNMSHNGLGEFLATDLASGPNSSASTASGDYKLGAFTETYQKASAVSNKKVIPATNIQWGEEINVDLDNASNLWTIGESVSVLGDNPNNATLFGITGSATARTSNATTSGVLNVFGLNVSGNNGYHTWGGNFTANSTVVNTVNTWTHGIESNATGGNLEAIGGIFYAQGSPGWNKGVYAISRNNGTFPGTKCYGVHGLADASNNNGYNIGVVGFGTEFVTANTGTTAIGVAGIIGSNSWGSNYFPVGLRIGVFGTDQFAATFGSPSSWAGYFNGAVFASAGFFPSDRSLKKDVAEIKNSIDIINKLNPVSYNFKEDIKDFSLPAEKQYGFISQEVKEILPELTREIHHGATKDSLGTEIIAARDILSLNYNGFIAILTKGIQEQQAQIEIQDEKINDLQNQIDELKKIITSTPAGNSTNGTTAYEVELSDKAAVVLDQNVPNPFAEQTVINFIIPEGTTRAQMLFHNATGQLMKAVDITERGKGQLTVFANDLSNGTYTYTLVVDGKLAGTKKMERQR